MRTNGRLLTTAGSIGIWALLAQAPLVNAQIVPPTDSIAIRLQRAASGSPDSVVRLTLWVNGTRQLVQGRFIGRTADTIFVREQIIPHTVRAISVNRLQSAQVQRGTYARTGAVVGALIAGFGGASLLSVLCDGGPAITCYGAGALFGGFAGGVTGGLAGSMVPRWRSVVLSRQ